MFDETDEAFQTGSAFAAFEEGVFVTNWHVVGEADSVVAITENNEAFALDVYVAYDAKRDIAIMRTYADTGIAPLPLGDASSLPIGSKVVAIGSPLGYTNEISVGMYSGMKSGDDGEKMHFTAPT